MHVINRLIDAVVRRYREYRGARSTSEYDRNLRCWWCYEHLADPHAVECRRPVGPDED